MMINICNSDSCYTIHPTVLFMFNKATLDSIDSIDSRCQRLGHIIIRDLTKLVKKELVLGIPKTSGPICGLYHLGKQIRSNH